MTELEFRLFVFSSHVYDLRRYVFIEKNIIACRFKILRDKNPNVCTRGRVKPLLSNSVDAHDCVRFLYFFEITQKPGEFDLEYSIAKYKSCKT